MNKGFFAYSSRPEYSGEFIEEAICKINNSGVTYLSSWKKLEVSGKFIINEVLKEIDESEYFCADLTGMNNNVLFEIGYAIAKGKSIWLILDSSHTPTKRKFGEFNLLTTIGYSAYTNSGKIEYEFFKSRPFELKSKYYDQLITGITSENYINTKPLLFLKSQYDTGVSH